MLLMLPNAHSLLVQRRLVLLLCLGSLLMTVMCPESQGALQQEVKQTLGAEHHPVVSEEHCEIPEFGSLPFHRKLAPKADSGKAVADLRRSAPFWFDPSSLLANHEGKPQPKPPSYPSHFLSFQVLLI